MVLLGKIKKRRGPAPTGTGWLLGVRIHPPLLKALDAWISAQPTKMSRPEAVRKILTAVVGEAIESTNKPSNQRAAEQAAQAPIANSPIRD